MKAALVTGATGMLGSYIAARLLEEGLSVRALVRQGGAFKGLCSRGIEPLAGDVRDEGSVAAAARGCDAIFHAAAAIGAGSDAREFQRSNVDGTAHVISAAARSGARLVHVSSTAVFGTARYHARPTDEEHPLPVLDENDAYGRSKQEGEHAVLAAQRSGRVWASIVRPPMMYGLRDRQFVPRVAPVLKRRFFPLIGGGSTTLPLVHADAVADGAVRAALHEGANGRVYLLANDFPVTVAEFVRFAARGLGRGIWAPNVPGSIGRLGFVACSGVLRWSGRPDLARHARGTFRMLVRDNPFNSERARRELGWSPRIPPAIGIPDAFRSWAEVAR